MPAKKTRRGTHRHRVSRGGTKRVRVSRSPARSKTGPRSKRKLAAKPVQSRKRPSQKRRPARPSIAKRVRDTERAIQTLGQKNVRRGSHDLGTTRSITPTKRGFGAVRRVLGAVTKSRKTFSYDLEGSYIGKDGKRRTFKRSGVGIPRVRDVRRRKGETQAQALSRVVEQRIRIELMGMLRRELGGYVVATKFRGRKITKKQAADQLRKLKRSRSIKFRVRFKREV